MRPPAFQADGAALFQPKQSRHLRSRVSQRLRAQPAWSLALSTCQEYRRNVGICLVNKRGLVFAARSVMYYFTCVKLLLVQMQFVHYFQEGR